MLPPSQLRDRVCTCTVSEMGYEIIIYPIAKGLGHHGGTRMLSDTTHVEN